MIIHLLLATIPLWRKDVPMVATGPLAVHEAAEAQDESQFQKRRRQQAVDGRPLFWQRTTIAKTFGWPSEMFFAVLGSTVFHIQWDRPSNHCVLWVWMDGAAVDIDEGELAVAVLDHARQSVLETSKGKIPRHVLAIADPDHVELHYREKR